MWAATIPHCGSACWRAVLVARLISVRPGFRLFGGHVRLFAWLDGVLGARRDLLVAMLFFLLHFLVVRDVAWIGHSCLEFFSASLTARLPFGRLSAVTGVSGSGKSTLIEDVLHRAAVKHFEGREDELVGAHDSIAGLDKFQRVVMVDQSPIGRTPRSCPVTYMNAYAPLREIYGRQPAALARGWKDGAFSFNTAGGRCEHCEGAGWVQVEMYFLADLMVPCEVMPLQVDMCFAWEWGAV